MLRIGVYVCDCGTNIAGVVNVPEVVEFASQLPYVVVAREYKFFCSDPGQEIIKKDIREKGLTRSVVAACSPFLHENTFRKACASAGLNPYLFQMANIREHCSWVHTDKLNATEKAKIIVASAVFRTIFQQPLLPRKVAVKPAVLVVGGGIAGIEASLQVADAGVKVYLVEREPTIGGQMAKFDKTFPTLDCASCILTPKMTSVKQHPNIELLSYSEVIGVDGYVGNFKIKVKKKSRYVREDLCVGCGECAKVCPVEVASEFDEGLGKRKAIYSPFPQAVPNCYTVEWRKYPPCQVGCPLHQNAYGYIALIAAGRFEEAMEVIRRENPLPAVCAYYCHRPCERICERRKVDEPISIRELKRFVVEYNYKKGRQEVVPQKPSEIKVAIIGSGPAGLSCADELVRKGYQAVIFEPAEKPGGLLRSIPDNQLPKDMLDEDISYIQQLGVQIRTNSRVSLVEDLRGQGYKAIFIDRSIGKNYYPSDVDADAVLRSDVLTLQTKIKDVFAGGEESIAPASVINSIATGKSASESIHRFIKGEDLRRGRPVKPEMVKDIPKEGVKKKARIELIHSVRHAIEEASRCLKCSVCCLCLECIKACPVAGCIDFSLRDEIREIEVGAVIIATGFKTFDASRVSEYGYGVFDDVYTSIEIERMINSTGPTGGEIRLRNGKKPQSVAILHCVGSRDKNYNNYCSKVCCMYSLKLAHLIKERTQAEVYNFYIDIRAGGKGYEEFYHRILEEGVHFIRGKAAEVTRWAITKEEEGRLIVVAEDTSIGAVRRVPVDMVVLAVGLEPSRGADEIARMFNLSRSPDGFFLERHPKLAPAQTNTDGIFIAGTCQGPKDIPDSVAQAGLAASCCLSLISQGQKEIEPITVFVNQNLCTGCKLCMNVCKFNARVYDEKKKVVVVEEALCKGCGTCVAACPSKACQQNDFRDEIILSQLESLAVS